MRDGWDELSEGDDDMITDPFSKEFIREVAHETVDALLNCIEVNAGRCDLNIAEIERQMPEWMIRDSVQFIIHSCAHMHDAVVRARLAARDEVRSVQ
jgi:hypothetical protein